MVKNHQALKNIVVIGGGTGSSVVLSGLKTYPIALSAIISVADSGGSTGRLRDEFGFQAVGDIRQALAALAKDGDQNWIRDLLLYRFAKGHGLAGHNLGNLILTALQDMTGSTAQAADIASKIFRLNGHIYPATAQKVELVITYQDGTIVVGEHHLNPDQNGGKKIAQIALSPAAAIYSQAAQCLKQADLIIIGPGDLYASILPNLIVQGMPETLKQSQAKIVYVLNLMTVYTQTHNFSALDHIKTIENTLNRQLDMIVINSAPIPQPILSVYQKQHEYPVKDDLGSDTRVIRAPLITQAKVIRSSPQDPLPRSFLRHDPQKLAEIIYKLI